MPKAPQQGFTLIEMSIVLVIIGLIVGGVLAGQDLIRAAGVRATISQIEKYNTAVNTFYSKYGALPGDMNASLAAQFGFAARGTNGGEGDGNGVIEGTVIAATGCGQCPIYGETGVFWVDLSQAGLIEGGFNTATETAGSFSLTLTSTPSVSSFFPPAKLGGGNYIYMWSGGNAVGQNGDSQDGQNYFGLSAVTGNAGVSILSQVGLTVAQANSIDTKTDDGMPQSGNVMAVYINGGPSWVGNSTPWSSLGSSGTCYDNRGAPTGTPLTYSTEINNGAGVNCALSFRFQ